MIDPTRIPFKHLRSFYKSGFSIPLVFGREARVSPWQLYQRIYPKGPYSFFLDSLRYLPPAQRYSYIGWRPYLLVLYEKQRLSVEYVGGEFPATMLAGPSSGGKPAPTFVEKPDLIREMRNLLLPIKIPPGLRFDFFPGGAVGFFGYELAEEFEAISLRSKKGPSLPRLLLLFFRDVMVFDHKEGHYYLISWLLPPQGLSFQEALRQAEANLAEMERALLASEGVSLNGLNGNFNLLRFQPEISKSLFEKMVRKAKAYIQAGDIYQANLSQRFSFKFQGSPLRLYDRLRQTNPSPFSAFLHLDSLSIASSSPELLIEKKGRRCRTSPIAGTRPRGRGPLEQRRFAHELLTNEKERAEHLMLVDLERNDLGRVSEWRSVRVKDFMRVEKYARVIHLVSEIESRLHPSRDEWDLIRAMFPGGTITGCPKIRSMEVIDELEPVERGIYTGSLGYVGFDGNLKLNLVIRTLVLLRNRGFLQVGAGIVADSEPEREYEETLAKGEALAEALIEASSGIPDRAGEGNPTIEMR